MSESGPHQQDGGDQGGEQPGYWERKAAEEGPTRPAEGVQLNPQSGQPVPPQAPYQQAPYQQPYPQAGYPQQPYPQAPGYAAPGVPGFPGYVLPDHPKSTAALIVGLVAVGGAFTCLLPILASPVAWVLGAQARREIRSAPQQWGGDGKATAGMVLGIIGTTLLVIGLILLVVFIAVIASDPASFDSDTGV